MTQEREFQPEWTKPEYWPERRRAPGYPGRWFLPTAVVIGVCLLFVAYGLTWGPKIIGWIAIGSLILGLFLVYQLTLNRFDCPQCGKRLPLVWPKPKHFVRFHCKACNVIWLTGIQAADDDDGGGGDAGM